ncbi:hypothetical protein [Rosistilla oblonga]|uniref:hypothetical protein n=1 Tax=Rosistilla oblonga TaxID=2527990 RepID=UPI003A97F9FE
MESLEEKLQMLRETYPLVPHTAAGQMWSSVRRMKAEKELGIPINRRTGFAVSLESGLAANEMQEEAWEEFCAGLCDDLHQRFPELYRSIFRDAADAT